jgi:2-dehydro-3-deoxyphosphogalactonate aldolase
VVSPNCDPEVIAAANDNAMVAMPGVLTPTEAFAASKAGATFIKLFPCGCMDESYVKNLMAVLPKSVTLLAVGSISEHNIPAYWSAGARGFGIGGEIYRAGDSVERVAARAASLVESVKNLPR